ncbi:MAG TPA: hypothetical protein VD884_12955 [Ohtaekwangia sp.]|nr:hypothetical protein [Ohtaekwangia sp.]
MKNIVAIVFYLLAFNVRGQPATKEYIENWIRLCDPSAEVHLVKAFHINGEYFDVIRRDSAFRARLRSIEIRELSFISYSNMKMDNYVPGKGTIGIFTIEEKEINEVIDWLDNARKRFQDAYATSQDLLRDSKDPVLVIDGQSILPSIAKETLEKIDPKEIYDISDHPDPAPASIYGQNARNGLVQIWTRGKYMK